MAATTGINPNPYTAAPAQSRAQGYGNAAPQNPGGGGGAPGVQGYGNMNFGWTGMNDATAQMGVQFGKSAVAAGQDYVEKNVSIVQ
jgi:hypothetical protein